MCDGTRKHFDMLQKSKLILQSLSTGENERIEEGEGAKDEIKETEKIKDEEIKTKSEGVEVEETKT